MSSFKIGDIVRIKTESHDGEIFEIISKELTRYSGHLVLPYYKIRHIRTRTETTCYTFYLALVNENPISKEEQVVNKIKQLWTKQSYYREHVINA